MVEIASLLPALLVYALLLFAAYILFRQVRKLRRGDMGCTGCPSGRSCSKTAINRCSNGTVHDKKENE